MHALQDSTNACKSSPRSPIEIRHTDTETQCKVDPADPWGDCKSCAEQKRPKIRNLPCLRYKKKAFRAQLEYLDIYKYITDAIHQTEGLIRNTYVMAYKYARETAVSTIIR